MKSHDLATRLCVNNDGRDATAKISYYELSSANHIVTFPLPCIYTPREEP